MTKTSHELLKQEKKENKVIEYVKKLERTPSYATMYSSIV